MTLSAEKLDLLHEFEEEFTAIRDGWDIFMQAEKEPEKIAYAKGRRDAAIRMLDRVQRAIEKG